MIYKIIKNNDDLLFEYKKVFIDEVRHEDLILYVGIESNDIIFELLKEVTEKIVVVEKNNFEFKCNDYYYFINDNILNICKYIGNIKFDLAVISFTLHENNHVDRLKIVNILKLVSNKIILIEPLKRDNKYGILFENTLVKYNKFYESLNYWENMITDYNKKIILQRNQYTKIKLKIRKSKYIFNMKLQDIVILIWEM